MTKEQTMAQGATNLLDEGEAKAAALAADNAVRDAVTHAHQSAAIRDILSERTLQITRYGHLPERDDNEPIFFLPRRATDFLRFSIEDLMHSRNAIGQGRKRLVKAGALILAAIDRIDRVLAAREEKEPK